MTDLVAARQPFVNGESITGRGEALIVKSPATGARGYGRERGAAGIRAFQQLKHVVVGSR